MIVDKELLIERFGARLEGYDSLAVVQKRICDRLAAMAAGDFSMVPQRILEVGAGTGFLTKCLAGMYPEARLFINDLIPDTERYIDKTLGNREYEFLPGDAEEIRLPEEIDLVATASTIQWMTDPQRFIEKIFSVTRKGGYLLLSTFGPDNFLQIRSITGHGLDYLTPRQITEKLASAGYRVLGIKDYHEVLNFAEPVDVLDHIRSTGVNSVGKPRWNGGTLAEFEEKYRKMFTDPAGVVTLTYHPVLVAAEKI